jgi:hypothetical protein
MRKPNVHGIIVIFLLAAAVSGCGQEKPDPRLCQICLELRGLEKDGSFEARIRRDNFRDERVKKIEAVQASYELRGKKLNGFDCPDCDKAFERLLKQ